MKSILTAALLLSTSLLRAEVPTLINYQGLLTDINGNAVFGTKTFTIGIYDSAGGGVPLYTETLGSITVQNGLYHFQFGNEPGLLDILSTGNQHWLQVSIDGVAQTPRERLISVPFAMRAKEADTAGMKDADAQRVTTLEEELLGTKIFQHAYQGGPRPTTGANIAWDAYSASSGVNSLLVAAPEGAYEVNQYRPRQYSPQDLAEIANPNLNWNIVKTLNCSDRVVEHVKSEFRSSQEGSQARFRVIFNYTDGTNTTAGELNTLSTPWVATTTNNPSPTKTVSTINVQLAAFARERSTKVLGLSPTTLEINLPIVTGAVTHSKMLPFGGRESGDNVTYKLGNGIHFDDNLPTGSENAIVNLASNPTKLWITLHPSATPKYGGTSLYSWILVYRVTP